MVFLHSINMWTQETVAWRVGGGSVNSIAGKAAIDSANTPCLRKEKSIVQNNHLSSKVEANICAPTFRPSLAEHLAGGDLKSSPEWCTLGLPRVCLFGCLVCLVGCTREAPAIMPKTRSLAELEKTTAGKSKGRSSKSSG